MLIILLKYLVIIIRLGESNQALGEEELETSVKSGFPKENNLNKKRTSV